MFPLIIELIYWSLLSNDIRLLIFGLLRDYVKSNSDLKQTIKKENINEDELDQPFSLFNPNIISKLIKIITPNELNVLKSIIKKVKNNELTKLTNKVTKSKNVKKTSQEKEQEKINDLQNQANQGELPNKEIQDYYLNSWFNLSSSWFKKAIYKITDENTKTGSLTALFQSDNSKSKIWYGPYTYPAFPYEIWVIMIKQTGKNGSGAGTIFWKFWNHTWLPSQLRKYVKKRLKQSKGLTKGEKTELGLFTGFTALKLHPGQNINVAKTMAYIHRLERNFPKLKTFKTLKVSDIGSNKWRKERKDVILRFQNIKRNTNRWK